MTKDQRVAAHKAAGLCAAGSNSCNHVATYGQYCEAHHQSNMKRLMAQIDDRDYNLVLVARQVAQTQPADIAAQIHEAIRKHHSKYRPSSMPEGIDELVQSTMQSGGNGPTDGGYVAKRKRVSRSERTWSPNFIPQTYGGGESTSTGSKKDRSEPEPMLYTGHLFTGYPQGLNKLAVVFKTGKSDHFEKERRAAARTFGISLVKYETTNIAKEVQGASEVAKRNVLRESIRSQYTVYHFGENDAVLISSIEEEEGVIDAYFQVARKSTAQVIA